MGTKSAARWSEKAILAERARIKKELDDCGAAQGLEARLRRIQARIGELEADESPQGRLCRYIYAMSALVHHERHGGLTDAQVEGLIDVAHTILLVQGIKPIVSSLSFLYGDLHQVSSQIHRQRGKHWPAAWDLQLAMQFSRRHAPRSAGFDALSFGIRSLRLGHGIMALKNFALAADDEHLSAPLRRRATLYRIKTLRLCRELAESAAIAATLDTAEYTADERRELEWEALCRECHGDNTEGDLTPLLLAVRRGRPHCNASYFSEAYLWATAWRKASAMDELPALRTMVDAKVLAPRPMGTLYQCLKQLAACYDGSYPFITRIRGLGAVLTELDQLVAIDLELLVWLSATRWLARHNVFALAALTLREYAALSLRLTEGRTTDALAAAADLADKDWVNAAPINPPAD